MIVVPLNLGLYYDFVKFSDQKECVKPDYDLDCVFDVTDGFKHPHKGFSGNSYSEANKNESVFKALEELAESSKKVRVLERITINSRGDFLESESRGDEGYQYFLKEGGFDSDVLFVELLETKDQALSSLLLRFALINGFVFLFLMQWQLFFSRTSEGLELKG